MNNALRAAPAPHETVIDATDRALIQATQAGLPLTPRPYHTLAELLGITADEVMQRLQAMLQAGIIRRIAAVPNHYALGYKGNGMSVWNVPDERIDLLGPLVGGLDFDRRQSIRHHPSEPPQQSGERQQGADCQGRECPDGRRRSSASEAALGRPPAPCRAPCSCRR